MVRRRAMVRFEADMAYEGRGSDNGWWKTVVSERKEEEELVWKGREERGKMVGRKNT